MAKYFEFHLPVFKQGDDLAANLSGEEGNVKNALLAQAHAHTCAADMCRRLAGVAAEYPEMNLNADCHHIGVHGLPEDRADALVKEDLLCVEDWEEDEDDQEDVQEEEDEPENTPPGFIDK